MERFGHYPGMRLFRPPSSQTPLTSGQSLGWEHYEVHEPEPHILLFKYVPNTQVLHPIANMSQATHQLSTTCHGTLDILSLFDGPVFDLLTLAQTHPLLATARCIDDSDDDKMIGKV